MKNKNSEAIRASVLYNEWLCQILKGKSPHTFRSYKTSFSQFMSFLESRKDATVDSFAIHKHFSEIVLLEWCEWLESEKGCSPESTNIKLAAIKSYLHFCSNQDLSYREYYMKVRELQKSSVTKKTRKGLSENAIAVLFRIPNTRNLTELRDLVFMELAYSTAARINELLSIKLSDLYLLSEQSYVILHGKGNKDRIGYIASNLCDNLKLYLTLFHDDNSSNNDYLFYSRIKGPTGKLSQEYINQRLLIYTERSKAVCDEIVGRIHCHLFRHAKATHLINAGMNIVQVSKILGHSQIQTTMQYLDITARDLESSILKLEDEKVRKIQPLWNDETGDELSKLFNFNQK